MTTGALSKAFTSEDSEGACHVLELPLSFLVRVGNVGDSGKSEAASCQGSNARFLRRLLRSSFQSDGVGALNGSATAVTVVVDMVTMKGSLSKLIYRDM